MSNATFVPDKVHFVGSIGLDSVKDVYKTAGRMLGRRIIRMPDGEPGARRHWVFSQYPYLRGCPFMKQAEGLGAAIVPKLELKPGIDLSEVRFGELCYAREARSSYQDFVSARSRGELPKDSRFQVSLPTPFAVVAMWIAENDKKIVEPPYEEAMLREVEAICEAITRDDLCIQWDVCAEMLIWDDQPRFIYGDKLSHDEIINRLARLAAAVPNDVELGFHFCYGDLDAEHVFDPRDAGKMVELANALFSVVKRPIAYIHMPVPIKRSDDAFFVPFQQLKKPVGTQIFLGVVHADGVEGTKNRITAASRFLKEFGIATECGMSRSRSPELVEKLLAIHRDASTEPS